MSSSSPNGNHTSYPVEGYQVEDCKNIEHLTGQPFMSDIGLNQTSELKSAKRIVEVIEDDRGQKQDKSALFSTSTAYSTFRIDLANQRMHDPANGEAIEIKGMHVLPKDEIITELASPILPPEEFAKSSLYNCTKSTSKGDIRNKFS